MKQTIISRQKPLIQYVASLKQTKHRAQHKQYIAEGVRTCSTLVAQGHTPVELFVTEPMLDAAQSFIAQDVITLVNDSVMGKISAAKTPSGILGLFDIPQTSKPEKLGAGIVLARIADPGNMGTLIRTTTAMNLTSVVIVEGVDPWNPKVVQASAGTIGQVDIFVWSWEQLQQHKKKYTLCALVMTGGKPPHEIVFGDTLLVIGSEAHGIPAAWADACEQKLSLLIPGKVESLNAAVAGSIALYLAYASQ